MKRMLTAALALLLALSLCACGAQDTDDTPTYPAAFSGLETLIDTAREEGRLTVCGTGDEAYMTALCEKFEELFDIKTTYRAITAAQAGSVQLPGQRRIYHGVLRLPVLGQRHGDVGVGKAPDEVGGAVDGVHDEGPR